MKKVKIIATLGPASSTYEQILALAKAGADVFRLNFSHADYEFFEQLLAHIARVRSELAKPVAVLADISGPKIRVKNLGEKLILQVGDFIEIYANDADLAAAKKRADDGVAAKFCINYPQAIAKLKQDDFIFLCDGAISVQIVKVSEGFARAKVLAGGALSEGKGINFPSTELGIDILTPKDRADIAWARERGVQYFALSFVQSAADIERTRELAGDVKLLAKIEKFDAIENIEAIIDAADGIMIARGDLGIELPYWRLPLLQKRIVRLCASACKPVITATQMLLSLTQQKTATRAEISDVANAVMDGSGALMLSEESAMGIDPAHAVSVMAATIVEAQKAAPGGEFGGYVSGCGSALAAMGAAGAAGGAGAGAAGCCGGIYKENARANNQCEQTNSNNAAEISTQCVDLKQKSPDALEQTLFVLRSAASLADSLAADGIICLSSSGASLRLLSALRPRARIIAAGHSAAVLQEAALLWGVNDAYEVQKSSDLDWLIGRTIAAGISAGVLSLDGCYIIVAGYPVGISGSSDMIKILRRASMEYYLSRIQ